MMTLYFWLRRLFAPPRNRHRDFRATALFALVLVLAPAAAADFAPGGLAPDGTHWVEGTAQEFGWHGLAPPATSGRAAPEPITPAEYQRLVDEHFAAAKAAAASRVTTGRHLVPVRLTVRVAPGESWGTQLEAARWGLLPGVRVVGVAGAELGAEIARYLRSEFGREPTGDEIVLGTGLRQERGQNPLRVRWLACCGPGDPSRAEPDPGLACDAGTVAVAAPAWPPTIEWRTPDAGRCGPGGPGPRPRPEPTDPALPPSCNRFLPVIHRPLEPPGYIALPGEGLWGTTLHACNLAGWPPQALPIEAPPVDCETAKLDLERAAATFAAVCVSPK